MAAIYRVLGVTPLDAPPNGPKHDTRYTVQRTKRRCRSTLTDSGRRLDSMIPVDSEGLLT